MTEATRTNGETKFVSYEYMSISVRKEHEPLYSDCYENFGWQPIANWEPAIIQPISQVPQVSQVSPLSPGNCLIILKFKRNRNIKGKSQLNLLQKQCESALTIINSLEKSKESYPTAIALTFGLTGLIFFAGAVLSFIADIIPLFIIAVIFGLVGCALSLFNYKRVKENKTSQVAPKIEEQYEIIENICEQARDIWR
ncbi:MAG: phage holin family protein [Peptococcaceae bacterium]